MRAGLSLIFILVSGQCNAEAEAMYLANAGVLVTHGETSILFDPLFRNNYGQYQLLPADLEQALMQKTAPFDGVDAVFISHYHGDHFSAGDIAAYLQANLDVRLFAPVQATEELLFFIGDDRHDILERITGIDLAYGDDAITLSHGMLTIDAFHIPHSGWPDRTPEVQNIAFRVTFDEEMTVLHLGDADTRDVHFASDSKLWDTRRTNLALPPYWFFTSAEGSEVLEGRLMPGAAVGIHVPRELPPAYSKGLEDHDLFRTPGETRAIPHE